MDLKWEKETTQRKNGSSLSSEDIARKSQEGPGKSFSALRPSQRLNRQTVDDDKKKQQQVSFTSSSCCPPPASTITMSTTTPGSKHSVALPDRQGKRSTKTHKRTASLTDLRIEDRKRVANLIQELADLGDQKEKVEDKLKHERADFESAIKQLIVDQKKLLNERQCVQTELAQCQQMLGQLQQVVLVQNQSTSESATKSETPRTDSSIIQTTTRSGAALDQYLQSYHSSAQSHTTVELDDAMDVDSEIGSVNSEAVSHPVSSSTILHNSSRASSYHHKPRERRPPHPRSRQPYTVDLVNSQNYSMQYDSANKSLDYTRKDLLVEERKRLLEEQKELRKQLIEQERVLKATQEELFRKQHIQRHEKMGVVQTDFVPMADEQRQVRTPHQFAQHNQSYENLAGSYREIAQPLCTGYSVGVQVATTPDQLPNRPTQDISAQADLPPSEGRRSVGKRSIPSPLNHSRHSSIEETMQRTQTLLKSARKIIDDVNTTTPKSTPLTLLQDKCSPLIAHTVPILSSTKCTNHTYNKTPKHQQVSFNYSEDATLATDINDGDPFDTSHYSDADKTELELLEDVFFVK